MALRLLIHGTLPGPCAPQGCAVQCLTQQQQQPLPGPPAPGGLDACVVVAQGAVRATTGEQPAAAAELAHVAALRARLPQAFLVLWHPGATEDPFLRVAAWDAGVNMVTCSLAHLREALARVSQQQAHLSGPIACDWCGLQGLTPQGYHLHQPLYHIYHANLQRQCKVCRATTSNLARHLHDAHPPPGCVSEERTGMHALVVIRRPSDGRYLLVQEHAGSGFWLPGGGVDFGESIREGAMREAVEEAGVHVAIKGLLAIESLHGGQWRRVIFYAEPAEDMAPGHEPGPKTVPDFESAGACFVDAAQLRSLPLRSPSELEWVVKLDAGAAVILPPELPSEWAAAFSDWRF